MKFDLDDPQIFNIWRANYHTWTSEQHMEFCEAAANKWPDQKHFTKSNFDRLFIGLPESRVMEIGGWRGELAAYCFERFTNIKSWDNFDICSIARTASVVSSKRYYAHHMKNFTWFRRSPAKEYDVCVASHMIEHLANVDFALLANYVSMTPKVMFEAPLAWDGNNWHNDASTHMLTMGWKGVCAEMKSHGFKTERFNDSCYLFTK